MGAEGHLPFVIGIARFHFELRGTVPERTVALVPDACFCSLEINKERSEEKEVNRYSLLSVPAELIVKIKKIFAKTLQ